MTAIPSASDHAQGTMRDEAIPGLAHLVLALLVFAGVLFFRIAADVPLNVNECLVGQTAREMSRSNNWILPRYGGEPRLQKPPLAYWTAGLASRLTGRLDALSLRIPTAVSAVACMVVVWSLANTLFGRRVAFVSSLVFASMSGVLFYARQGTADMQLTFWCTFSVLAFERALRAGRGNGRRAWMILFAVCLGAGMLAKLPMPLAVVLPALFLYLLVTYRLSELPRMFVIPALLIFAGVFGWWVWAVARSVGPETLWLTWQREFIIRFQGGLADSQIHKSYYLPAMLAALVLPWTFALPEAIAAPCLKRYAVHRRAIWLPWLLLVMNLMIFSAAQFKRTQYIVPALPYAAMLLGLVLVRVFWSRTQRPVLSGQLSLLLSFAVVLASGAAASLAVWKINISPWLILVDCGIIGFGTLIAIWTLEGGAPRTSFLLFALTGMVGFHAISATVLRHRLANPDYGLFAAGLSKVADVSPEKDLLWLALPDPRMVFDTDRVHPRFMTDPQVDRALSERGAKGTEKAAAELLKEQAFKRLAQASPCFLVAEARRVDGWATDPDYAGLGYFVYRHPAFDGDPNNDYVVITNRAGLARVHREARREIVYTAPPGVVTTTTASSPASTRGSVK